jgi:hypothetical protein
MAATQQLKDGHTTEHKNKVDGNSGNQRSNVQLQLCPTNGANRIMEYMFSLQNLTIYCIVVIYRPVWSNFSSLSITFTAGYQQ